MVRTYVRKTNRASYGPHILQEALDAIKEGKMSKKKASEYYGIPRPTLIKRLKNPNHSPHNLGRFKPVFDNAFESELVMHCVEMQQRFYGLTLNDLKSLAFQLADKNGIQHPFSKVNKMAGKDWMRSFMCRYPQLSLRRPEPTSLSRATGFNRVQVGKFYDILQFELAKGAYTAAQIYNIDETGISTVQNPSKVIANKGCKQVGKIVSAERGTTTTVVCAMNAAGSYIPPVFIFKRQKMNDRLMRNSPTCSLGLPSPSGWMDTDLFLKYMDHFIKFAKPSVSNPLLIILDGHQSHKSLALIDLARENHITIVTIPPHTSHRLQPLDLTVYGPLKTAYNRVVDAWLVSNPGKRVTDYELTENFSKAYNTVCSIEKAVKGFKVSGIFPFNKELFTDEDYAPSAATDQPLPCTSAMQDAPHVSPTRQTSSTPHTDQQRVHVTTVSPYPHVSSSAPGSNRKRKAETAAVITSTPNKKRLEELQLSKNKSKSKHKPKLSCRKLVLPEQTQQSLQVKQKCKPTNESSNEISKVTPKDKKQALKCRDKKRRQNDKDQINQGKAGIKPRKPSKTTSRAQAKPSCITHPLAESVRPPLPRQPLWKQNKPNPGTAKTCAVNELESCQSQLLDEPNLNGDIPQAIIIPVDKQSTALNDTTATEKQTVASNLDNFCAVSHLESHQSESTISHDAGPSATDHKGIK
jgi:hypothetical protein